MFHSRTTKHDGINYEELESKYNIHKYYPKYFHNDEAATPDIKQQIYDKPIYAKANEHLKDWVNPGVMKVYETELDYESGKMRIRKQLSDPVDKLRQARRDRKEERREDRRERREERKEDRQEKREERREDKQERREEKKESRDKKEDKHERKMEKRREKQENKQRMKYRQQLIDSKTKPVEIRFNNPFGNQASLEMYKNTFHGQSPERKNSVTSKLISLISNNSDELGLTKTNSFDQSKSSMTTGRKKSLFKKRYSENLGMYIMSQVAV